MSILNTREILDSMIKSSYINQISNNINHDYNCTYNYLKDMCTIRFSSGRRSGHTTSIDSLCDSNSIIICLNHEQKRLYDKRHQVMSVSEFNNDKFVGTNMLDQYDRIIIDCSSYIDQEKIDNIYEVIKFNKRNWNRPFLILHVG